MNADQTLTGNVKIEDGDVITIFGVRYSGSLFRELAFSDIPPTRWFQIIKREDGVISISVETLE